MKANLSTLAERALLWNANGSCIKGLFLMRPAALATLFRRDDFGRFVNGLPALRLFL